MKRIIGKMIYALAKHLPESDARVSFGGKWLRGFCAGLMFDYCGRHVNVDRNAIIGRHVVLGDYSGIGKNSYISDYVTIGKYVMMGPECVIHTRNHRFSDTDRPMCFQGFQEYQPVVIADDVWIGSRVIILPGVRIGKGAVIGAGSIVTRNIKDYEIAAGNPARVIGTRGITKQKY